MFVHYKVEVAKSDTLIHYIYSVLQVSILSTFYEQLLRTKVFRAAFSSYVLALANVRKHYQKRSRKTLMKLKAGYLIMGSFRTLTRVPFRKITNFLIFKVSFFQSFNFSTLKQFKFLTD